MLTHDETKIAGLNFKNETATNMGFAASVVGHWQLRQQLGTRLQSGLDGMLLSFLLLSSSTVFQSAEVPGRRNTNSTPAASPVRYGAF